MYYSVKPVMTGHTLRLRWLGNCLEIYLINTDTIAVQHSDAHNDAHSRMIALAILLKKLTDVVHIRADIDLTMNGLEDED